MAHLRKQNQTAHPFQFLMVLTSDHLTGATGKTPVVKLSKNGGTGAAPAGAITEIDATNNPGWYQVAGNATDTNTLGPLIVSATATACDPTDSDFQIVAFDPDDAVRFGLTALPNVTANASGGLPTIDASLRVSANVTAIGGTATTYDANNLLNVNVKDWNGTATTLLPLTDKAGYSLSGSQTFNTTGNITGNVSGSVGSVTGGVIVTTNNDKTGYSLSGSQTFNVTGTSIDGTAQAGSTTTITLAASDNSITNSLANRSITIVFGTGAGQSTLIVSNISSTKVVTVAPTFATAPDSTSQYKIGPTTYAAYVLGGVSGIVGGIATAGITSASFSAGSLPAASGIKKNTALASYAFAMTDSTTHAPKTTVTVTATRSLDGAAFAACTNAVTELSNGVYNISLSAADLNANVVVFRFTGTSADDLLVTIVTQA